MTEKDDAGDFASKHAPQALAALRALAQIAANQNTKPEDRERAREQLEERLTQLRGDPVWTPYLRAELEEAVRKSREL
jgi:hypothetical protein